MEKPLLAQLWQRLREQKKRLEAELSSFATKDPNLKGDWDTTYPRVPEGNLEEAADEVEEYGSRIEIEHALETQLKEVNDALERIEKGTYGLCEKCGKEIAEERLKASPEAKLCTECNK